ncbi:MAG: hypothetical protein M9949_12095 [Candidatus Kapabacteria bacterium]|nr:hypothetical protein [Candidatus Kapabacteria bacterium]
MTTKKVESGNKQELISSYLTSLQNDDESLASVEPKTRLQHELEMGLNGLHQSEIDSKSKSFSGLKLLKYPLATVFILLSGWFLFTQLNTQNVSNQEISNALDANTSEAELISYKLILSKSEPQNIKTLTTILDVMFLPDDNNAIKQSESQIGSGASFTKAYSIIKKAIRSNDLRIEEGLPGYIVTSWYYQNEGNNSFVKSRLIAKSDPENENKIVFYVEKTVVEVEDIKDNKIFGEQLYSDVLGRIKSDFNSVGL